MTDLICPAGSCPPVLGNIFVWRDAHHLTASYASTLGDVLIERFRAELPSVIPESRVQRAPIAVEARAPQVRVAGVEVEVQLRDVVELRLNIQDDGTVDGFYESCMASPSEAAEAFVNPLASQGFVIRSIREDEGRTRVQFLGPDGNVVVLLARASLRTTANSKSPCSVVRIITRPVSQPVEPSGQ